LDYFNHESLGTFQIYRSVPLRTRNASHKNIRENQNTFMLNNVFQQSGS